MYESLTIESLHAIRDEALASLSVLEDADTDGLEAWRVQYVGRRGLLTLLLREIGSVPIPQRREIGTAGNAVKSILQQICNVATKFCKVAKAFAKAPEAVPEEFHFRKN